MSPLNNALTLEESLRVACQMGRADIELVAPAIGTLARELSRLEAGSDREYPPAVLSAILAGENAGIADALTALDWLYVHYRQASDKKHAAEVAKVL